MADKKRRKRKQMEAPVERERPRAAWWGYVCHGKADRCLAVGGGPMPLCARCFGFYVGLLIGIPVGSFLSNGIRLATGLMAGTTITAIWTEMVLYAAGL